MMKYIPVFILLSSCTTVERPNIEPWKPPEWVPKEYISTVTSSTQSSTTSPSSAPQVPPKAIPIKTILTKQRTPPLLKPSIQDSAFWQRKISLNFDQINLTKALNGLAQSQQFSYRNALEKTTKIKHYSAVNAPLINVLQDLAQLADSRIIIDKKSITFTKNKPFWAQYTVDYPNIKRQSISKTQFNQSIGSISNKQNTNANIEISNEFKNEFWLRLEKVLSALITHPNASSQVISSHLNHKIVTHPETGAISVYGKHTFHTEAKKIIDQVNKQARRQAHIEMAIMEVELNDRYEAGIDWSFFENNADNLIAQQTLGSNLGSVPRIYTNITGALNGISLNFGARLIEQFGTTKVLSSPQIRLLNNQTALLKVVDNIVYFTIRTDTIQNDSGSNTSFETQAKSIAVGIVIALTATILPDDSLIINLKPTISRISEFVNDPHPELAKNNIQSRIPVLRERELESFLHIKSNEVAVIGGLIQNRNNQQAQQSPGISGFLGFDSTQNKNTELLLFLRAKLL